MPVTDPLIALAFEQANDAIVVTDDNWLMVHVNQAFIDLYGYGADDIPTMRMEDFRSPKYRDRFRADMEMVTRLGERSYETEHRRRDGSVFPVDVRMRRVSVGDRGYWISTLRDISERKAEEQRMATLRRLYDTLLAASSAVVQSPDRETLFRRICDACIGYGFSLAWVGLRRGNTIVPTAVSGASAGYLDQSAISMNADDPMGNGPAASCIRTGRTFICNDFLFAAATQPWHERAKRYGIAASATVPLTEGGAVIGALALYGRHAGFFGPDEVSLIEQFAATVSLGLDRLAAEQASHRLTGHPVVRTILDAVPAMVFVSDVSIGRVTGNQAAEQAMRVAPGSNLSRTARDSDLGHVCLSKAGNEIAPHDLPIRRAARGEVVTDDELELCFDDGSTVFIQGNAVPLRDSAGEPIGAVGAFIDVTRRRNAEEALKEAREIAEKAVASKMRFMASASHDLRQPLQGLVLLHDVLAPRLVATDAAILEKARSCTATLCEMVDDLLDVAKLDAGIIAVDKRDCAVEELLTDIVAAQGMAAAAKGLTLRYVRSGMVVRTDPALMRRIVCNLTSNAVRYTHEGGIVVGCRRRGDVARIEVWDSGIGIPADRLEDIFEEFRQLDNPSRSRDKGSGLGLAIVDRSARLLGVKVMVRSTPGRGSCFAVEVPAAGL